MLFRSSQLLDRIISRVISLNELYQDQVTRKAELNLLSTPAQTDDLSEFYSRLGKIKQHYQKYPDASVTTFEDELAAFLEEDEGENEDEEATWEDREPMLSIYPIISTTDSFSSDFLTIFWRGGVWTLPRFIRLSYCL